MPAQAYICITGPYIDQQSLANGYFTPGTLTTPPSEVRNDVLSYSIQPVTQQPQNGKSLYLPDYDPSDTFAIAVGNPDTPPTGGTFAVQVGSTTTGLTTLAYNITAAALQTALNAALTTEAKPLCSVTLAEPGIYAIAGVTNGAITHGFFQVTSASNLFPISNAFFAEGNLGSATSVYQVLLEIRQAPMAYSEPTDELPDADVALDEVLNGSGTSNHIQRIRFTVDNTYSGSVVLSATADSTTATCGIARPGMDATEIGRILAIHEKIIYADLNGAPDNITVETAVNGWIVSFVGTLGNDAANTLFVENSVNDPLVGPRGKSGTINYNTYALNAYSLTTDSASFELTLQIQRTRSGDSEPQTLIAMPQTIRRDVIDISSAVPTPLPSYYTTTESNARFARRDSDSAVLIGVITGSSIVQRARILPITNGAKLQASVDGATWQDFMSWAAS